ncbi:hypothetical protein D3C85_1119370 [compost metagenome]
MTADAVGHDTRIFIDNTADHGHMLAQLAVDQAAVDVPEYFGRLEIAQLAAALEFKQQARGHELQQHGDEGRRSAMPGNVCQIKGDSPFIDAEIVGKVARQVQRRNDLVLERQVVGHPGAFRQHVHLHLTPGSLVLLQQVQAGLELAVGGFELFPVALVFQHQSRAVQGPANRMLEYREVFQRLDQVVGRTQAQGFDGVVHHPGTRNHDYR